MDLTSVKTIKSIQAQFGFTFKKGLGQNFLTSRSVLEDIAAAADCSDGVIEIGPGFGVLTGELAKAADKVVAVEVDERLIEVLKYTLSEFDNVKVIHGDVLKTDLNKIIDEEFNSRKISVAANLPYYITTPIIAKLMEDRLPLKNIVVMVQKEVADRLMAGPGTKNYGAISVMCRYYAVPELVTTVRASQFVPPPKVDSAVIKLAVRETPAVSVKNGEMFFKAVRAAFSQRRKTLLNCVSAFFGMAKDSAREVLESVGIDPSRRGETLTIEEFGKLADALCSYKERK